MEKDDNWLTVLISISAGALAYRIYQFYFIDKTRMNTDDDEWSDDDEEKDAEKLHKYNLPPSPSKNDFYDDYDMYDYSNYGSDDEKNVQIEKMSTFRMDTKKKKSSDSNNNKSDSVRNKGPPIVKKKHLCG